MPLVYLAILLTACSGGSQPAMPSAGIVPDADRLPLERAASRLTLLIPAPPKHRKGRSPSYLPSSVESVAITLTADSVGHKIKLPWLRTYTVGPDVHTRSVTCSQVSGGTACTLSVLLPPGSDALTIGAYDAPSGGGHLLSLAMVREAVKNRKLNQFPEITLAGVPGSLQVKPGAGATGSVATGFTLTGSSPVSFTLTALDAHGTPFGTQPGAPSIRAFALAPTIADASLNGSALSIAPKSNGTAGVALFLVAPDGDGDTALTTTTAAEPAGTTSLPVASTAGFAIGEKIIIDADTPQAEGVTILSLGAGTLNVGTTTEAHVLGAPVADVGSNGLGLVYVPLTVTVESTIVALGGCAAPGACQIDEFSLGTNAFVERTPVIPAASFTNTQTVNFLGFDAANTLYNADTNDYTIEEFPFDTSTQSSNPTVARTITGNSLDGNTNAQIGFAVSANGTTAAAIDTSSSPGLNNPVGPQLIAFAPGSTASLLEHTFANTAGSDYTAAAIGTQPSVAIMTDRSGNVIGYAVALVNLNYGVAGNSIANKIGIVYPDGSEQSILAGIGGVYADPGNPIIAWDQAAQALIYVDTATGNYNVLEFDYNGSESFSSGTTLASLHGGAVDLTISRDGEIAIAYTPGGVSNAVVVYNKTVRSTVDLNLDFETDAVNAIHFFPDDSLLEISNPSTAKDYLAVGGKPTSPAAFFVTPSDVPAGWEAFDGAISN